MLCSRFLKEAHSLSQNALFRWSESVFSNVLAGYQKTLRLALRHHVAVSLAALAMALVTVWMFVKAPKGFLPNEDTGRIMISTEAEQGVAFDKMIELQQRAADIVSRNPAVEAFMSRIGGGSSASSGQCRTAFPDPQTAQASVHPSMTSSASFARISPGFPASRSSRKILRPSASAAPPPRASINSLFRTRSRRALRGRRENGKPYEGNPGHCGRHHGPPDHEPAGARRHQPRQGLQPWH